MLPGNDATVGPFLGDDEPIDDPATRDPFIGEILDGRFELNELLAVGSHGRIYEAHSVRHGTPVAVKILRPEISGPQFCERFRREAGRAGAIRHPHTVDVLGYGTLGAHSYYIVLELLKGTTLKVRLSEGPLALRDAVELFRQLTDVLVLTTSEGIIHRDIKPSNIILCESTDGSIVTKLLDFGLIKADDMDDITDPGQFVGTPEYAAPEQIRALPLDQSVDVYALGGVIYHTLVGRHPFDAPTPEAYIIPHLEQQPPPMAERNPDVAVPEELERLVLACMAKTAEDRPSPEEILVDLNRMFPIRQPTRPPAAQSTLAPWVGLGAGIVAAVALVLLTAAAFF